jgi:hypothetical protein
MQQDYSQRMTLCIGGQRGWVREVLRTVIVVFSQGRAVPGKVYRTAFIQGLDDTCVLFERPV